MSNKEYRSTDALMRHLRQNEIDISGSLQKQQLVNTGYFHGYKGYRFFLKSFNNKGDLGAWYQCGQHIVNLRRNQKIRNNRDF